MLKERSRSFKIIFIINDIILILFSWFLAYEIRINTNFPKPFIGGEETQIWYFYMGIFGSLTHIAVFLGGNLYRSNRGQSFFLELKSIFLGSFTNLLIMLSVLFFFRPISYSRGIILYQALLVIVFVSVSHYIIRRVLRFLRSKGYNLRYVMIVGAGEAGHRFYSRLSKQKEYGYIVIGILGDKKKFAKNYGSDCPEDLYLGSISSFQKIVDDLVQQEKLDIIIAAISPEENKYLEKIYQRCEYESIDLKIIPDFYGIVSIMGRVQEIEGLPVISIRTVPLLRGYNWLLKRLFDIVFSFSLLFLISPVFFLIMLLVKFTSKGPVFIFQERMGLDKQSFKMVKFRSMYLQPEEASDTKWTTEKDPRITPVGQILRKYSIDEIPQFINVLFGQMSVVGPRPERPYFVSQFKKDVKGYMIRHKMKSGITGWAQVNGLRGDTSIQERVNYDVYYIENWSLWFDIRICVHTVFAIFKHNNAY